MKKKEPVIASVAKQSSAPRLRRKNAIPRPWRFSWIASSLSLLAMTLPAFAGNSSVYMEDMTWMEIRDRIKAGATTVIVPTGGTEQNGPHMVTGKHNVIVRYTAVEIANRLGNALVAPVMTYVPEGRISPPEGHMQFPGTLSLSPETFMLVLEDTASSLKQNGFKLICFVGDSGGNQKPQKDVAERLSEMWAGSGTRVITVSDYYDSHNGQDAWISSIGMKSLEAGSHAGFEDTSELMEIHPQGIRSSLRGAYSERDYKTTGAMGDATKASPATGRQLLELKIEAAVNQISKAVRTQ